MSKRVKIIIALLLVAAGVAGRLMPHAGNFTPLAPSALFAGFYLGGRYGLAVPAGALLISDFFLGFYAWPLALAVYAGFAAAGAIGFFIRRHKSAEIVLAASLAASLVFFLLTNWAVWQFSPWYDKSWAGLSQCFTLALPFFRNTVLGDLFYAGIFFGAYELVLYGRRRIALRALTESGKLKIKLNSSNG